ncbi:MAG: PrsW family intramembrane metalloprotease [Acidobacteria bacterium]|nr:PrsW family intramembrane metalloprotease [Acidobacteriota bacterium]
MNPDEMLQEYERLLRAGIISQEEYRRQVGRLKAEVRRRAVEEEGIGAVLRLDPLTIQRVVQSQVFWVVLVVAMMPLLLASFGLQSAQGMILYFAFLWFFIFLRVFRLNLRGGRAGDIFFVIVMVTFFGLGLFLPALRYLLSPLYALIRVPFLPFRWLGFVLGVGITEEMTKAMPVFLLLWIAARQGRRLSLQATVLLGVASGLAFAGFENILYSEQFGARIFGMSFTQPEVVLSRLLMTPFLHSVWAGVVAFNLGLVHVSGPFRIGRAITIVGPGLMLAALLHGSYDTLAASPVLAVLVGAVSYLIFVLAVMAAKAWEGESESFLGERVL